MHLGGNGAMYYEALKTNYGQAFVDSIFADKDTYVKADRYFYEQKTEEFREILTWDAVKLLDYTKALGRGEGAVYL